LSFLIKLKSQNEQLKKENLVTQQNLIKSKNEHEDSLKKMDDNIEEVIKSEEFNLRDLQEKNNIVSHEVKIICK
jgi:hypothetical protein